MTSPHEERPLQRRDRTAGKQPNYAPCTPSGVPHVDLPSSLPARPNVKPRAEISESLMQASFDPRHPTPFGDNNRMNPGFKAMLKRNGGVLPLPPSKRRTTVPPSSQEDDEALSQSTAASFAIPDTQSIASSAPTLPDVWMRTEGIRGPSRLREQQQVRSSGQSALTDEAGHRVVGGLSSRGGHYTEGSIEGTHNSEAGHRVVGSLSSRGTHHIEGSIGGTHNSEAGHRVAGSLSPEERRFPREGELLRRLLEDDRTPPRVAMRSPVEDDGEIRWGTSPAPSVFAAAFSRGGAPSSYPQTRRTDAAGVTSDHAAQTENAEDEAFEDEDGLLSAVPQGRCMYEAMIGDDLTPMVALAWSQAQSMQQTVTRHMFYEDWVQACCHALYSMKPGYLRAIVDGNLEATVIDHASPTRSDGADPWHPTSIEDAPCIYMQSLVGNVPRRSSQSDEAEPNEAPCQCPSPDQMKPAIDALRQYVDMKPEHANMALKIDNSLRRSPGLSTMLQIRANRHRFLCKETEGQRVPVKGRIEVVRQFCDSLERRLGRIPSELESQPMRRPLSYIGYAFNFSRRNQQHKSGTTNWLMQLVQNTFEALFPKQYTIVGRPICLLAAENEVKPAELLFALLSDSFALTGGGFNIHDPGVSTASSDMEGMPDQAKKKLWAQRVEFRRDEGFSLAALERESRVEPVEITPSNRASLEEFRALEKEERECQKVIEDAMKTSRTTDKWDCERILRKTKVFGPIKKDLDKFF